MKPHDIFNLAMRLIGLIFLYQGLSSVPAAVHNFCPIFPRFNFGSLLPSLLLVGWPMAVGLWLIKGAPWLMRWAYPNQTSTTGSDPKA